MLEHVIRALEQPHPVLILAGSIADLPETITRILPRGEHLAPLSRDILMALLRFSHSATGKLDGALRNQLPGDHDLARLDWPTLAVALRAATPRGVAKQLCALMQPASNHGPTLDDIEGYGEAEDVACQMVSDLQSWSDGHIAWSDVQRSVLFYGGPGTGKSHLASAMSNSAGVALVRGSFAAWQAQGHLGHMLKAMRASFDEAAQARPAILVIDEIDAVGDRADPDPHNASYRHQVVNGFLEELDNLKHLEGVLVVGTCNYPKKIDAAVLRPGRFDIKVEVPLPGAKALARMLRDGFSGEMSDAELARLTRAAAGQSAAGVEGALRNARSAARAKDREVSVADVLRALEPDPIDDSPARDHRTALHECGHAIVGTFLGVGEVRRVTMTATGGETWIRLAVGEGLLRDYDDELAYMLAGRAAERLILGEVAGGSGGAPQSDLAQATRLAVQIDTQLGLGAEGLAWLDTSTSAYLRNPDNAGRVRARLEAAEIRAMHILDTKRGLLVEMATAFQECRILEGEALEQWLKRIEALRDPGPCLPEVS
ncbi:AAA family ATPase [Lentibacter sp. XHP0401]|nr:AAA family ATPase [Lentibacter sp. XHP0401]